jgi:hypothetical protein
VVFVGIDDAFGDDGDAETPGAVAAAAAAGSAVKGPDTTLTPLILSPPDGLDPSDDGLANEEGDDVGRDLGGADNDGAATTAAPLLAAGTVVVLVASGTVEADAAAAGGILITIDDNGMVA